MSKMIKRQLRKILTFLHIPIKNRVFILTFQSEPNYGQQLQNFSLSEKIKELGFHPKTIRWWRSYYEDLGIRNHNLMPFRRKYIFSTGPVFTEKELRAVMREGNKIIIGGDQVFRLFQSKLEYLSGLRFAGDFVYGKKVLVSYAASFGRDTFRTDEYITEECRKLLRRFDRLSVREKSGVDILRNVFGVDGVEVLDPVFLLNQEQYDRIIKDYKNLKVHNTDYIAYACVDAKTWYTEIDKVLARTLSGEHVINIMKNEDVNGHMNTVEQWLYDIKHAKLVITNSFHAAAFSIIFKVPFLVVSRDEGGNSRFETLLGNFNLSHCWRENINDITTDDLNMEIDWENVQNILDKLRHTSEEFLKSALYLRPTYKRPYVNLPLRRIRKKYEKAYLLRLKSRELEIQAQDSIHLRIKLKHRIIRMIIKYLVSKRRYKELKTNPDMFFRNTNSGFIRFLGLYYI